QQIDLPAGLVLDSTPDRPDAVDVLDLAASSTLGAWRVHADVGVDAHAAFLHLGVGRADSQEDGAQFGDVLPGLLGRADVGAADDLDQRHTGAVEVDQRVVAAVDAPTGATEVRALAGVLLHVG